MRNYKIIISGGGTGGHLFPALSIANEIKRRYPDADILFVGADNRMEMERVPAAGYRIIGLPVTGFNRQNLLRNIQVVGRLLKSLRIAKKIIRDFKPDIAIGVGGYASGPTLWIASSLHIPVLIQEQNSYAGVTNKLLGKRAARICVAYRGMDKYFPENRIVITGNPVRRELEKWEEQSHEAMVTTGGNDTGTISGYENEIFHIQDALHYFGMQTGKPVLLILGGSLGARTINNSVRRRLESLIDTGIQVIWQTGRTAFQAIKNELETSWSAQATDLKESVAFTCKGLWCSDFISRMDYAYAIADVVVSRAGAGTLSELCLLKKAVILVPSPNVAEDHQTKNARTLSESHAAILIPDKEADERLIPAAIELLKNKAHLRELSENIAVFAQHNSARRIVDEVIKLIS